MTAPTWGRFLFCGDDRERLLCVVEMRYLDGLTEDGISEAVGVSTRTVQRECEKARLLSRSH